MLKALSGTIGKIAFPIEVPINMKKRLAVLVFASVIAIGMVFFRPGVMAQSGPANQTGSSKPATDQPARQLYQNLQVLTELKSAPWNEFTANMDFVCGALSVSCNYCHVEPWESDAKKTKLIARNMMKMMRAINDNNFGGRLVVTCNTCHQGRTRPNAVPNPWYKTPEQIAAYNKSVQLSATEKPETQPAESATALPDVDQVMASYRKAVGADAVKSVHLSGTNLIALNGLVPSTAPVPLEMYAIFPDKFLVRQTIQGSEIQQIVNGDHGWILTRRSRTPIGPAQLAALKQTMEVFMPVKYANSEAPRKVTGTEKIGDRTYYVVQSREGKTSQRLYFDARSGLLYKARAEIETLLGTSVNERTFEDYRDVNGVKMPYLTTAHFMGNQAWNNFSEVQINIDLDPAKFEPPAPPPPKSIKVDTKILDDYVGEYQLSPGAVFICARDGDRLYITPPNGPQKFELFAETEAVFFLPVVEARITFVRNDKGEVAHLVMHQNNADRQMIKIK